MKSLQTSIKKLLIKVTSISQKEAEEEEELVIPSICKVTY